MVGKISDTKTKRILKAKDKRSPVEQPLPREIKLHTNKLFTNDMLKICQRDFIRIQFDKTLSVDGV